MKRFDGKRVFVTGGSSGIGRALVTMLDAEGASVFNADLREPEPTDVSDEASVRAAVARAVDALGGIDIVGSNAGLLDAARIEEMPVEAFDRVIAVNLRGAFLVAKHTIPHLRAAGGGSMVFTGSTSSVVGARDQGAYSAAKAGIANLARCLADELAADGIRVNCVCPGWVDTPFNDPVWQAMGSNDEAIASVLSGVPMQRQARPEEIAPVMAFLVSDEASYMTGETVMVDGGLVGVR